MQTEQKQIGDLSVIELKAMVYDQLGQREIIEQNIRVLNQEIQKRGELASLQAEAEKLPKPTD